MIFRSFSLIAALYTVINLVCLWEYVSSGFFYITIFEQLYTCFIPVDPSATPVMHPSCIVLKKEQNVHSSYSNFKRV